MLHIKAKKIKLSLSACVMSMLLLPALSIADSSIVLAEAETGSIAARQAREQREALAKKAAEREAKKAEEAQKEAAKAKKPAETEAPVDVEQSEE